jgi:hypothetical protein
MIKHVGKHNSKKVVILYRQVPGEDHMALVAYSDTLPRMVHDEVMKALESPIGQNAKEFSDVLFRTTMADGTNALTTLHKMGWIKKVPANQVLVTPNSHSSVRLDELNDILNEMAKGEEAITKLADLDNQRGMAPNKRAPKKASPAEVGIRTSREAQGNTSAAEYLKETLDESDLANQRLAQALKMEAEAKGLLAEAARLKAEANELQPTKAKNVGTRTKKATTTKKQTA